MTTKWGYQRDLDEVRLEKAQYGHEWLISAIQIEKKQVAYIFPKTAMKKLYKLLINEELPHEWIIIWRKGKLKLLAQLYWYSLAEGPLARVKFTV